MDALVLAGERDLRLYRYAPGPVYLAPVARRPFIAHLVDQIRLAGIPRAIFALGWQAEDIADVIETAASRPLRDLPPLETEHVVLRKAHLLPPMAIVQKTVESIRPRQLVLAMAGNLFLRHPLDELVELHALGGARATGFRAWRVERHLVRRFRSAKTAVLERAVIPTLSPDVGLSEIKPAIPLESFALDMGEPDEYLQASKFLREGKY